MDKKGYKTEVPLSDFFMENLLMPFLGKYKSPRTRHLYQTHILAICTYFYHSRRERYSFEQLDIRDAQYYFGTYLSSQCERGEASLYTCRGKLTACRSFAAYLEEMSASDPALLGFTYVSPFKDMYFQGVEFIRTDHILLDKDIDKTLSCLESYDTQLFIISLLSFRMLLTQDVILSLKKDYFFFIEETGRTVGVLSYLWRGRAVRKRIPADIVEILKDYVSGLSDGPIFRNRYGNALTMANLTRRKIRFEEATGMYFYPAQLRKKGLIDLVAQNPDALDDIELYTGLSKKMIEVYGNALDRIAPECIADKGSYRILQVKERRNDT